MRLLLTTSPSAGAADLARAMVSSRLVACCNMVAGVRSMYWWKGEVQDESEVLMFMETTDEALAGAMAKLTELHPHDVPKILALDPADASEPYLAWLREACSGSD